jgi:hypothetical protein
MVYRYFDGRPPSLEPIRQRNDSYRCSLWREADLTKIFDAPAQRSMGERMTLFSLTLGRRPARALEIGSFRGGSAQIIVHAMDLNGFGEFVMIGFQFVWPSAAPASTLARRLRSSKPS